MEEVKAAQNPPPTQDPNPPQQGAAQPPAPPQQGDAQPPAPTQQPPSKKRSLENNNDQPQKSNYFKMRRLLKDLRPHFIEVLRTPDFRNCKASNEIKEKMKLLADLYKQITTETVPLEKSNNAAVSQPEEQPENKTSRSSNVVDKQESENSEAPGSYIVGGSAFGWNFITFTGNTTPVYYGVTKESFRSAQGLKQV